MAPWQTNIRASKPPINPARTKPEALVAWRKQAGSDNAKKLASNHRNAVERDDSERWFRDIANTRLPEHGLPEDGAAYLRGAGSNSAGAVAIRLLAILAQVGPGEGSSVQDRQVRSVMPRAARHPHTCGVRADKSLLDEMKEFIIRRPDLASAKAREKGHDPSRVHTSVNFVVPMGIGGRAISHRAPLTQHIMANQRNPFPFSVRMGPQEAGIAPNLDSEFEAQYEAETGEWAGKAVDRAVCLLKAAGIDVEERASMIIVQAVDESRFPPTAESGHLGCIVRVGSGAESKYFAIVPGNTAMAIDVSGNDIRNVLWLKQHAGWFFDEVPDAHLYVTKTSGGVTAKEGVAACVSDAVETAANIWHDNAFAETDNEAMVHSARGAAIPLYDAKHKLDQGDYAGAMASAVLDTVPIVDDAVDVVRGTVKMAAKAARAGTGMKALSRLDDTADAAVAQGRQLGGRAKSAQAGAEGLGDARRLAGLKSLRRRLEITRVGQHYRIKSVPVLERQAAHVEGGIVQSSGIVVGNSEPIKPNMGARPSSLRAHQAEATASRPVRFHSALLDKARTGGFTTADAAHLVGKRPHSSFLDERSGFVYRGFVFRGDMRQPGEIFEKGFELRTKIDALEEVNGFRGGFGGGRNALDIDGKGISTSPFASTADGAGADVYGRGRGGYTYLVDARDMDGYDLYRNAAFARFCKTHKYDLERARQGAARAHTRPLEVNYGVDIPNRKIVGAFDPDGKYVPNPSYQRGH